MSIFRNVDIGGGLSDFWDYVRQDRPHRWPLWGLALAITWVIFRGVEAYLIPEIQPDRSIVYVESWRADRSAADVRADWVARAKETTRRNAERRAAYQRFADSLGIEYDSTEADRVTRETLGADADKLGKRAEPVRSTLAERAARGPRPDPAATPQTPLSAPPAR